MAYTTQLPPSLLASTAGKGVATLGITPAKHAHASRTPLMTQELTRDLKSLAGNAATQPGAPLTQSDLVRPQTSRRFLTLSAFILGTWLAGCGPTTSQQKSRQPRPEVEEEKPHVNPPVLEIECTEEGDRHHWYVDYYWPNWRKKFGHREVLERRLPIDYSKMFGDARVIFLREITPGYYSSVRKSLYDDRQIVDNMTNFAQIGITHLGLAMLTSDLNPHLDHYFKNGKPIPQPVVNYLSTETHSVLKRDKHRVQETKDLAQGYLEMIRAARKAGIRIKGIGQPGTKLRSPMSQTMLAHMTEQILRVIRQDPKNRMITVIDGPYVGYHPLHSKKLPGVTYPTVNSAIEERAGVSARVIRYDFPAFDHAISDAKLTDEGFMVPGKRCPTPAADYVVHLPGVFVNSYYPL